MRTFGFTLMILGLSACSPSASEGDRLSYDEENTAALRVPTASKASDTVAAQQMVQEYFALVSRQNYEAAWAMWGVDGEAWGGDVESFAEFYRKYESFDPQVGEPTEVKTLDGRQYVHVEVKARAKMRSDNRILNLNGRMMLQRDVNDQNEADWYIGGMDLRSG